MFSLGDAHSLGPSHPFAEHDFGWYATDEIFPPRMRCLMARISQECRPTTVSSVDRSEVILRSSITSTPRSCRGKTKVDRFRVPNVGRQGKFVLLCGTTVGLAGNTGHTSYNHAENHMLHFRMATVRPHVNKSHTCFAFRLRPHCSATTVRQPGRVT